MSNLLQIVPELIKKTFPIPGRFRGKLSSDIAELSHLLTNRRGDRSLSYLARPNFLSAYLHYFLPWNLYRLCLLLPNLELNLKSGDTITDLGSGPLTFASALWIARPDLRSLPLEINCVDRCAPVLDAGKKFFTALCESIGENIPWKINIIKEDIDIRQPKTIRKRKKASLVCAVNIFNEIYDTLSHNNTEGLRRMAEKAAQIMHNEALPNASILTVEPGVPLSGRFISFLRTAFLELNRPPVSPCPHTETCPFPAEGKKSRWCHFAFETDDAPKELQKLSASAKLPKERLVFSFLQTGEKSSAKTAEKVRVISDMFALTDSGRHFGRYGCSAQGLILLTGEKNRIEKINSLALVSPVFSANAQRDKKSGALIMEIQ